MEPRPSLLIDPSLDPCPVRAALIWGLGMPGCPATAAAPAFLTEIVDRARSGDPIVPPERKAAVRDMLRHGSYKPAGRSKPASEYLLSAALAAEFPLVNGPVDVNNAVSVAWGYPASIFDAARSGWELALRRGTPGESYVFNASGQSIDLEDLLCVCRRSEGSWTPCGNPVKDSMATKTTPSTTDVIAVVFAPAGDPDTCLLAAAQRFLGLLSAHCGAAMTGFQVVGGAG